MGTDVEKLLIRLEVTQRRFEKQLAAANQTADRRARGIERRFRDMNRTVGSSFDRMSRQAQRSLSRLAIAAGTVLGTRELARYADAWTRVNNQIRAAEAISGTTARATGEINDIANETRAGLEETASLYARLLRVSGDLGATEEDVARATEITAKAFKAGGAAASEQAAGVLQLSQALSSGFLQGDELRSIRENAPLLAKALAEEFETTIGGLKELGAQGELTSERVFRAILNGQAEIERAFSATNPTISEGFTALKNGLTEMVGAFDDGAEASGGLYGSLSDLGKWLSDNTGAATRFGAQVAEAFEVIGEAIGVVGPFLTESFGNVVGPVADTAADVVAIITEVMQLVMATGAGIAAAIQQAFVKAIAAVGEGGVAIANGAISAVEAILNGIVKGVQIVIDNLNGVIETANQLPGIDLPTIGDLGRVDLGRLSVDMGEGADMSLSDAFTAAAEESSRAWQEWETGVLDAIQRIRDAGNEIKPTLSPHPEDIPSSDDTQDPPGTVKKTPKSGKGSADEIDKLAKAYDRLLASLDPAEKAAQKFAEAQALINQAQAEGLITAEEAAQAYALAEAEYKRMLDQAKEASGGLGEVSNVTKTAIDSLLDGILDGGANAIEILDDLAAALLKAALYASLIKAFPSIFGASGIIPLANANGNAFNNGKVTPFARGGIVTGPTLFPMAKGTGLMGEAGPEAVMPLTRIGGKLGVQATGGGGGDQFIEINDYTGAQKKVRRQDDARGRRMVVDIVGDAMDRGELDGSLNNRFGGTPKKRRR